MKYLALIYSDENANNEPEQQQALLAEYGAFHGWLAANKPGKNLAGEALVPTTSAKTIRTRNGKTTVTDGPFAETKEHLGGFYLLEAESLDEAVEMASRIPSVKTGSVEVRAIMTFPGL